MSLGLIIPGLGMGAGGVEAAAPETFTSLGPALPAVKIEVDFDNDPTSATRTWTDITTYVREFSTTRGRNDALSRPEVGQLTLVLQNDDGRFDPTNVDGTYYPNVLPMRRVRVRCQWDSVTYNLFHGYIEDWPLSFPDMNRNALVSVQAADALAIVGQFDLVGKSYGAQRSDVRSLAVLVDCGFRGPGIDSLSKVVLHCDGADTSTTFTDSSSSPHTFTANGNAQIDTGQAKFGGASGLFDGTGDYLTTPDHADWDFGSGDFTVDCWVRFASVAASQTLVSQLGTAGNYAWDFIYVTGSGLAFRWSINGTAVLGAAQTWSPSIDTWYHVAATRAGTDLRLFVNGSQIGTTQTLSGTIFNSTDVLAIGATPTGASELNGWLDEVRVSKGIARWTNNFTSPTEAYNSTLLDFNMQAGESTIAASGTLSNTTAQAHLLDVSASENGLLFVDAGGTWQFHNRTYRQLSKAVPVGTVGTDAGVIGYREIATNYRASDIWNVVSVTAYGGTAEKAIDTASTASYYQRSLNWPTGGNYLVADQNEALSAAEYVLNLYRQPFLRVPQVVTVPAGSTANWPTVLDLELSDRLTLRHGRPDGGTIASDKYTEGVGHQVSLDRNWATTLRLSDTSSQAQWLLDDATLSLLGETTNLSY